MFLTHTCCPEAEESHTLFTSQKKKKNMATVLKCFAKLKCSELDTSKGPLE